jgi:hypothetical protein
MLSVSPVRREFTVIVYLQKAVKTFGHGCVFSNKKPHFCIQKMGL